MDFTSIPTDNLYKFMALSGLVVAGSSVWFLWKKAEEHRDKIHQHRIRIADLGEVLQLLDTQQKLNRERLERLEGAASKTQNEREKKYFTDEGCKLLEESKELLRQFADSSRELSKIEADSSGQLEDLKSLSKIISYLRGWMLAGMVLAGSGFYLWHVRFQKFQDQMIEMQLEGMRLANAEAAFRLKALEGSTQAEATK
jgi:hypothetical protein